MAAIFQDVGHESYFSSFDISPNLISETIIQIVVLVLMLVCTLNLGFFLKEISCLNKMAPFFLNGIYFCCISAFLSGFD